MLNDLEMMSPTMIVAAMGFAALTEDGLADLADVSPVDVHNVCVSKPERAPGRELLLQLTHALNEIGLVRVRRQHDGAAVGWRSYVVQQRWLCRLEKLPLAHRTR